MQKSYVIKRILYTIVIFFVVVTLNFFIPRLVWRIPPSGITRPRAT